MKLLDFYSTTCQPCRLMDPIVAEVVSSMDSLTLEKINVFKQQDMASKYGISAVPTFVLLNDKGVEVSRRTGLHPLPQLTNWIKSHAK